MKKQAGYPRNNEKSCLRSILTVRLIFMTRRDSYYAVNIKTSLINMTEEQAKTETLSETHTKTHNCYRLT